MLTRLTRRKHGKQRHKVHDSDYPSSMGDLKTGQIWFLVKKGYMNGELQDSDKNQTKI